ncbi:MAG TPA: hypothetical protein VMG12_23825 [Polyangiaceae bacterium]|nr:hypothetical protein [Polyangiaceae bacterium]
MKRWQRSAAALAIGLGVVLAALAPTRGARADGPGPAAGAGVELRRLFPRRAAIEVGAASEAPLWRLELTAEVLAACRPDLSDLRLLDARDQPVPFVIDPGPPPRATPTGIERRPARVLAAKRREVPPSGTSAARLEETFELAAPPPSSDGQWQLVLEADAPEFVRQLSIEGVRRDAPSEASAASPRVEGSLFRIRGLADEQLASGLPALPYERLVVQLASEELAPLRPRFFFELARPLPEPRVLRVPLAADAATSVGGEHRVVLARPAGIVPSALRLDTSLSTFERRVEVYDVASGRSPARVGVAHVFRLPLGKPAEGLEIELGPVSGQALELRFADGDNPVLPELELSAVVRAPSLVFAPPSEREGLQLYFGGGRARAPRYNLERLLVARDPLGPGSSERTVRLGPSSDNPDASRTPPLAFATRAGAPVDARLYSHQRMLDVAASSAGLVRVALGAADLGVSSPELADVRVVDAAGRQWPYLVDREPGLESVPLELGAAERRDGLTTTSLSLPTSPLAPSALVLDASDPYFDRDYRVSGQTPQGKSIELARGRLQRDAAASSEPIVIALAPVRVRSLALAVSDADDAPIQWTSATARVDVPRLYVLAEPGQYRLLLGNALDAAPSYDVARARDLILSVAFRDAPLGPLAANPDYRASAGWAAGDGASRLVLWGVLAVAVAALGGLTLRLVRKGEGKG